MFFGLLISSALGAIISNLIKKKYINLSTILYPTPMQIVSNFSLIGFGIGGLLVGFGTKLGNGCTSGHGLSGLPRFSLRSWVAVPTFFGVALLTANFLNADVLGFNQTQQLYVFLEYDVLFLAGICLGISIVFIGISATIYIKSASDNNFINMNGNFF